MRCLAARVNYKTLIFICSLFTLVTVLLWNKCNDHQSTLPWGPQSGLRADSLEKRAAASESNVANGQPRSEEASPQEQQKAPPLVGSKGTGPKYEEIDCVINEDQTIRCRREGSEVYMPFSWMEKYFEVYGKVAQYDGFERFEFSHSYSKVYAQRGPYHTDGVFMSFEGYNVEVRDRVKCISGVEGTFLVFLAVSAALRLYIYHPFSFCAMHFHHYPVAASLTYTTESQEPRA